MTRVISDLDEWRALRRSEELASKIVGFVPTMGNLHRGHLALIKRSRRENDVTVVSLFVNPTQFNEKSDLEAYPRTFREDLDKADKAGVDYLLDPAYASLYPDQYRYRVIENPLSNRLCGKHRPGHFAGVLTIVLKLLLLVRPRRAYFGRKDYQQLLLIQGLAKAFFLDCEIVPCPIVRDRDGLALSSRNSLLTPEERRIARNFPAILSEPGSCRRTIQRLEKAGFEVDYVEDFEGRRLGAVRIGKVRLIDNIPIPD